MHLSNRDPFPCWVCFSIIPAVWSVVPNQVLIIIFSIITSKYLLTHFLFFHCIFLNMEVSSLVFDFVLILDEGLDFVLVLDERLDFVFLLDEGLNFVFLLDEGLDFVFLLDEGLDFVFLLDEG